MSKSHIFLKNTSEAKNLGFKISFSKGLLMLTLLMLKSIIKPVRKC